MIKTFVLNKQAGNNFITYVCSADRCSMPLGAEDGRLVPGYFSASTYYNHYLAPWHGRVNHRWSWSARYRRHGQWLQISLGGSSTIKAIATQGRQDAHQWVTKYTVGRSVDGMRFVHYTEERKRKVTKYGSLHVSGKLLTYPSPMPTLILTSHLGQNVG